MGLYDQAVASNQNIWQQKLQQPSAVNRFMEALRQGQQGLAAQRAKQEAMAQQEALNQSLIDQRRQQAEREQAEFAMRQSNAPLEARSKEADIAYKEGLLKQMLTPKPTQAPDVEYTKGGGGLHLGCKDGIFRSRNHLHRGSAHQIRETGQRQCLPWGACGHSRNGRVEARSRCKCPRRQTDR